MARPLRVRYARIHRIVDDLLHKHRIRRSPIDIGRLARDEGMQIFSKRVEDDLSGFLFKQGASFVIGVNARHPPVRQRFTIAHELGHALLHEIDEVHVDRTFKLRSPISAQGVDIEEIEANTFAAWILMPEKMVMRDLEKNGFDLVSDDALEALARDYGVSRQSMTYRVLNLLSYAERDLAPTSD